MNKKGNAGDQLMIFSFLLFMVIIGGGIVAGTAIYFGSGYDARVMDAGVFYNSVVECLREKKIDFDAGKFQEEFYKECRFNKKAIEEKLVLRVRVNDAELISLNNPKACLFSGGRKNPSYPRCVEGVIKVDGKRVEIVAGSNEFPRRVNA